jgi:hypothetical protein
VHQSLLNKQGNVMGYQILHQQQHNEAQDSSSSNNEAIMPIKLAQMVKK